MKYLMQLIIEFLSFSKFFKWRKYYERIFKRTQKILFNNYIRVWKEGKVGLYNPLGKLLIKVHYDYIYVFDTKIYVKKNNKYGLYNMNGEMLIPCIFNKIIDKDTYFIVYLNDKDGIYDIKNNIITINCNFENN